MDPKKKTSWSLSDFVFLLPHLNRCPFLQATKEHEHLEKVFNCPYDWVTLFVQFINQSIHPSIHICSHVAWCSWGNPYHGHVNWAVNFVVPLNRTWKGLEYIILLIVGLLGFSLPLPTLNNLKVKRILEGSLSFNNWSTMKNCHLGFLFVRCAYNIDQRERERGPVLCPGFVLGQPPRDGFRK